MLEILSQWLPPSNHSETKNLLKQCWSNVSVAQTSFDFLKTLTVCCAECTSGNPPTIKSQINLLQHGSVHATSLLIKHSMTPYRQVN